MSALGVESGHPCPPNSSPLLEALCNSQGRIAPRNDLLAEGKFLRGKFALVNQALFSATADAEYATFERLRAARNSLAHGDLFDVTNLPISDARDLTQRLLNMALADQL